MAVSSRTRSGASARDDLSRDAGRSAQDRGDLSRDAGRSAKSRGAGVWAGGRGRAAGAVSPPVDRGGVVLGRARVGDLQRARILTAMTELVRERGVRGVTVAHVVDRSGVSRRTFYEQFDDREDCLLAAFEHALRRAAARVRPAYEAAEGWPERIRAALAALLEFLDAEPAMGGLCVVDALAAEGRVLECRAHAVDALIEVVHEGGRAQRSAGARGGRAAAREAADAQASARRTAAARSASVNGRSSSRGSSARPARIVAEGAVGAVLAVIHARMIEPDPKPLSGLLGPLMGMIVLPYLGPEAAASELKRPPPRSRRRSAAQADPLRELDMRLTYRTVRVLLAISELGGQRRSVGGRAFNNRQVADAAGVADQGQISKLLWRLEHLGLIANSVERQGRGEANAWSLTRKGREVERTIRTQMGE
jgi:AcrR family transcriptional regulator